MLELVYLSHANQYFSEQQLIELLAQARINNAREGVTGLLLYDGKGMFIQAIEGEASAVEGLFARIEVDTRHGRIVTLWRNNIETRSFPDWQMAFKELDPSMVDGLAGYSDYLTQPSTSIGVGENQFTRELLEHFKNKFRYP